MSTVACILLVDRFPAPNNSPFVHVERRLACSNLAKCRPPTFTCHRVVDNVHGRTRCNVERPPPIFITLKFLHVADFSDIYRHSMPVVIGYI
jgi:hypothetical protein